MSDYMKEAKRLAQAYADAVLLGEGNDEALAALLAHIQRGAVPAPPNGWFWRHVSHTLSDDLSEITVTYRHTPEPKPLQPGEFKIWAKNPACAAPAPDHFRDAAKMMPAPAEVPMPEAEFVLSYDGWHRRYLLKKMPVGSVQAWGEQAVRTYGAACRADGEAAGYARAMKEAGRDAERLDWILCRVGVDHRGVFMTVGNAGKPNKGASVEAIDAALRGEVKP